MVRKYDSKLREQQAEQTRELILAALAEEIARQGPAEVSIQEVADRAGVSHRTVYRYFPTREALVEAMSRWVDGMVARTGAPFTPTSLEHLIDGVRQTFRAFDEIGDPAVAMVLTAQASRARSSGHNARTEKWRVSLASELEHLEPDEREHVFAAIRALCHSSTWLTLRDEFGMSGEEAAQAVGWVVRAIEAELARRRSRGGKRRRR